MRLYTDILFHNMGNPPCYDLSHMNLSDSIIGEEELLYHHKIKLLKEYIESLPKKKILHNNNLGDTLNGDIVYSLNHISDLLQDNHHILKSGIEINKNGDRLSSIYNKYNDKKVGFSGADNILFKYNKRDNSLQIEKVYMDGIMYTATLTDKDFNTYNIETNMIIIKKKTDNYYNIRYNQINKENLDGVVWKKLENIQDFSIKKNGKLLANIIDDFDKVFYIHTDNNIKDQTTIAFKSDHSQAMIGQKYTYTEEGIMTHYYKDTGMAILEGNRKKRIPLKIPICRPFKYLNGDGNNINSDGFYMTPSYMSNKNYKTRNLDDKNIKSSKCSVIRNTLETFSICQREYPNQLIDRSQCNYLDNIFKDNNMTHFLNISHIYNLFYLFYHQYPITKSDKSYKKINYTKILNVKDIVGTHKIGGFYWIKKDDGCYLPKGTIFRPETLGGEFKNFSDIYNEDIQIDTYKIDKPLFEYYPDNSLDSKGIYLTSLYSSGEKWMVDFIMDGDYLREIPLKNINITQSGLDLLENIKYVTVQDTLSNSFSLICKPYIKIKCILPKEKIRLYFTGTQRSIHFRSIREQFEWVNMIEFGNKRVKLENFININPLLNRGSYLWNGDESSLYWIPDNKWDFHTFYDQTYEIDIQSIIEYMLKTEFDEQGVRRKLILDKMSNVSGNKLKLNKDDVNNIIKLLEE